MKNLELKLSDSLAQHIHLKASEMKTDVNSLMIKALEKFLFFSEINSFRGELEKENKWSSEEDLFNDVS